VAGTPLDFRRRASMAERLKDAAASPLLAPSGGLPGFDHSLLFSKPPGACAQVAVIEDQASGRRMEISTTEPALQLNSGSGFDGSETGSEGHGYRRYDGFAFETQHLPDSPNHPGFPTTALYPGQEFRALTSFRFSAAPPSRRDRMAACPRLLHNSMKKNVPTIRDVAAAAGVSTATVSKLVNGTQRFSPAVEATIRKVIADLGYRSNPLAQSMITGRTQSIGLSILDVANPHFTSIVKGANRVALAHGYNLLLVDTEENPSRERPLLEALSRRVDGMIVFSRMLEPDMDWMMDLNKPLVFFGRLSRLEIPWVASDDHRGAYMLARHLITLGHKRFAYLGFSRSRRDEERMGGIRECLAAHGLELNVHDGSAPSAQEGERMCSSIMLGAEHPDALICYNDLMALGFMKAAQTLGFKLPADVSVAGFDNIVYGNYTSPALTTVDLQSERMGAAAMEKLIATIAGKPAQAATMIEPQLILRESVAKRV
jgi:LacI family transcriptional regulator